MEKNNYENYVVSYETAKLLEKNGFNQETLVNYAGEHGVTESWYDDYRERRVRFDSVEGTLITPFGKPEFDIIGDTIPAPLLQTVINWLREKYKMYIGFINKVLDPANPVINGYLCNIWFKPKNNNGLCCYWAYNENKIEEQYWDTPEEAIEAAIIYCLTILTDKYENDYDN